MTPEDVRVQLEALRKADERWRAPEHLEESIRRAAARERGRIRPARAQAASVLALAAAVTIAIAGIATLYIGRKTEPASANPTITQRGTDAPQRVVWASFDVLVQPIVDGEAIGRVRIRVPSSALAAFGVAVVDPLAVSFIEADVDVGPDGNAQRVRFFSESVAPRSQ